MGQAAPPGPRVGRWVMLVGDQVMEGGWCLQRGWWGRAASCTLMTRRAMHGPVIPVEQRWGGQCQWGAGGYSMGGTYL